MVKVAFLWVDVKAGYCCGHAITFKYSFEFTLLESAHWHIFKNKLKASAYNYEMMNILYRSANFCKSVIVLKCSGVVECKLMSFHYTHDIL